MPKKVDRSRICQQAALQAFAKYWGFWKRSYLTLEFWPGWKQKATETLPQAKKEATNATTANQIFA